jgi:arylsulfatase A-like enzyme
MFYDLTTRVPCIIAGPGVEAGARETGLSESVDLAPTLLRFAGLPVPVDMVGQDLFSAPPRQDVIGEICLARGGVPVRRSWIRTERWSLDASTEIDGVPTSQDLRDGKLIDLVQDPLEHVNLYGNPVYTEVVKKLEARLDARTRGNRRPMQQGGPPRWSST